MNIDKTTLRNAGIVAGVGLLYWLLIRKKKGSESKSNFNGSGFGKRVMFTLTNKTKEAQVVPLFNAYSNIQNPNVSITPSISEFNRTLLSEPKLVKMIEIRATGSRQQAEKPIQIYCKDASGEMKSSNLYPMVSPFQKALDMTSVQPNNFTIDGSCYMNYTVDPSQTVILVVHYDLVKQPQAQPVAQTKEMDKVLADTKEVKPAETKKEVKPAVTQQPQPQKKRSLLPVVGVVGGLALGAYAVNKLAK